MTGLYGPALLIVTAAAFALPGEAAYGLVFYIVMLPLVAWQCRDWRLPEPALGLAYVLIVWSGLTLFWTEDPGPSPCRFRHRRTLHGRVRNGAARDFCRCRLAAPLGRLADLRRHRQRSLVLAARRAEPAGRRANPGLGRHPSADPWWCGHVPGWPDRALSRRRAGRHAATPCLLPGGRHGDGSLRSRHAEPWRAARCHRRFGAAPRRRALAPPRRLCRRRCHYDLAVRAAFRRARAPLAAARGTRNLASLRDLERHLGAHPPKTPLRPRPGRQRAAVTDRLPPQPRPLSALL